MNLPRLLRRHNLPPYTALHHHPNLPSFLPPHPLRLPIPLMDRRHHSQCRQWPLRLPSQPPPHPTITIHFTVCPLLQHCAQLLHSPSWPLQTRPSTARPQCCLHLSFSRPFLHCPFYQPTLINPFSSSLHPQPWCLLYLRQIHYPVPRRHPS